MHTSEVLTAAKHAYEEGAASYPTWQAVIPDRGIRLSVCVLPRGYAFDDAPFCFNIDIPGRDVCLERFYTRTGYVRAAINNRMTPDEIAALNWKRTK